jgi:hypothetical protein
MALPPIPNPCPDLKPGLSLGAPEHKGFVSAWNWLFALFRSAKDNFVFSVNGATGDLHIVSGEGISVTTRGSTLTIAVSDEGDKTDKPDPPDKSGGGAGDIPAEDDGGDVAPVPGGDEEEGGEAVVVQCDCGDGAFAWDANARQVKPGGFFVRRRFVYVDGSAMGMADGLYSLKIDVSGTTFSGSVVSGVSLGEYPTDNTMYVPLYTISGGKIKYDYRGAVTVPLWE